MLVEFADFELDDERFELRRRGARIAVQPKVLTLILHLVRNHERVVSVSELRAVLWPELAVGMTSLTRAVRGARRHSPMSDGRLEDLRPSGGRHSQEF